MRAIWNPASNVDAPLGSDAGDACRRENARAELPNRVEDHRREREDPMSLVRPSRRRRPRGIRVYPSARRSFILVVVIAQRPVDGVPVEAHNVFPAQQIVCSATNNCAIMHGALVIAIGTGDWLESDLGFARSPCRRAPAASLGGTQSCHLTSVARTDEPVRVPRFTNCDVPVQPTQSRSA